jgi:thioester reductase-like protein
MSAGDERLLRVLQDARERLDAERRRRTEPIAIVGIGCRLPGDVTTPDEFWRLLSAGIDATTDVPGDRWDVDRYFDADPDVPGKMYVRRGGFLRDITSFEPEIFDISPREAEGLDPQQRLLLEVAWEALEDAGIAPDRLGTSATGVFVGLCFDDYARRSVNSGDPERIDAYTALGSCRSVAAGRIAYVLGLQGPAMQLDTSCSSSLVALHLACQSLRTGECDRALVGGANVICAPEANIAFSKLRALAPDGRCKTFDASADGYARGEGCGMVVLRRLSDALADGDHIRAVVRATALNHDGRSNGLTAPNGAAQEAVIRTALKQAGLEPEQVSYVEAHGTGTPLGDPVEVLALARAYRRRRTAADAAPIPSLLVGSVKTNVGHLEGAAGVTGLIKTVLALERGQIPPHLHYHTPNPHIPWAELAVTVPSALTPWPANDQPRRAGLSAFGMSGTNAHVILEEAPAPVSTASSSPAAAPTAHVVALSARTETALLEVARRQADAFETMPAARVADACATLNTGRATHPWRIGVAGADATAIAAALRAAAAGQRAPWLSAGRVIGPSRVGFLFSGQGAQYPHMTRELFDTAPVFRAAMERAARASGLPLLDVLYGSGDGEAVHDTRWTQPAIVAVGWALAELWRSWGVVPAAVMGHSVGEIAAACVAGVIDIESAMRLAVARGEAMQTRMPVGAMTAVRAPEERVRALVADTGIAVSIASVNGPRATVVAGPVDAVSAFEASCTAASVESRRLATSRAFHSPDCDAALPALALAAASLTLSPASVPLIANVSGAVADDHYGTADYWSRHAREPVQFSRGIAAMHALGCTDFLEVGPSPVLVPMAKGLAAVDAQLWVSLQPGQSDALRMRATAAAMWVRGAIAELSAIDRGRPTRRCPMPVTPFVRRRYWIEPVTPVFTGDHAPAGAASDDAATAPVRQGLRDSIVAASPEQQAVLVERYVRDLVAGVLRIAPADLRLDQPLHELGFDSLMLVEIETGIRKELEVDLPVQGLAQESAAAMVHALVAALTAGERAATRREDYLADATLDPDVRGQAGRPSLVPTALLVTGTTGFLGAFLLDALARRTNARLVCLVRARTAADGFERVHENLDRYGLWTPDLAARLDIVTGDLSEPRFGLSESDFQALGRRVDAIYNNGAQVSYVATYPDLRASHVGGTREALRLASIGRATAVHHVSSIAAFESSAYRGATMSERTPPVEGSGIHLAYSQCKWVSEAIAREASTREMPITLYRPSLISGHSVSGAWNTNDFLCRMLKGIVRMGAAPADLDLLLDFSPVDYVAESLAYLSMQPGAAGEAFHLHHPQPLHWRDFVGIIATLGYGVQAVDYGRWVAEIERRRDDALYPLLPFFRHRWQPDGLTYIELNQRAHRPALNCDLTVSRLSAAGIVCAPLDHVLFARYFSYLSRVGFLDAAPSSRT